MQAEIQAVDVHCVQVWPQVHQHVLQRRVMTCLRTNTADQACPDVRLQAAGSHFVVSITLAPLILAERTKVGILAVHQMPSSNCSKPQHDR